MIRIVVGPFGLKLSDGIPMRISDNHHRACAAVLVFWVVWAFQVCNIQNMFPDVVCCKVVFDVPGSSKEGVDEPA